jgi:hypothetical protein
VAELEVTDAQRLLRRAVQLEGTLPPPKVLGVDALAAAAGEIGLQPEALAMALAEARAGVEAPERTPRLERIIGPRRVVVVRRCRVPAADVDRLAGEWLERGHVLRVTRADDGLVVARRRDDAAASAARAVRALQGAGRLSKVREVRTAVGALADGTAAVCVHADVADGHTGAVAAGAGLSAVGLAGVGLFTAILSPFVAIAAPVVVAGGVLVARHTHRANVERVARALEETADAVARGEAPPAALGSLRDGLRRIRGR